MGHPVMQWQILARSPPHARGLLRRAVRLAGECRQSDGLSHDRHGIGSRDRRRDLPIGDEGHPLVQLFVDVADVAACAAQVEQLGGQIIIPPQVLPDGDEMAIVMDTEGLSFGIVKRR